MNQKEIKSLRQNGSRQGLQVVQMSCLAGCRLFTRYCALNTCKANRGAKQTFIRAKQWGAGCGWASTWEHTALPLLVCHEPRNPGVLPARAVPATHWGGQGLSRGGWESWAIFTSSVTCQEGPLLLIRSRGWGAIRPAAVPPPLSQEACPLWSDGVEANTVS